MTADVLSNHVVALESGGRPKGGASQAGDIPSLGAEHLDGRGGFKLNSVKHIPRDYYNSLKRGKICANDILIVKDGATTGKTSYVDNGFPFADAAVNEHVFILRINQYSLLPRYAFHFLNSPHGQTNILSDFRGATVGGISKGFIEKVHIPLPPLPEQKRIAAILDQADALREKRRAAIAKLDELLQSVFLDMFGDPVTNPKGWDVDKLGSHFSQAREGTKCGPFGSALKRNEYVESGVPVWQMDNIKGSIFKPENSLFITKDKYKLLKSYSVESGDIIISRAGTVGKMCVVESAPEPSIISTNLIRLSLNFETIDPWYFVSLMTYCKGRVGRLQTGEDGAYSHMNTGILKSLDVPIPPRHVQKRFNEVRLEIESMKRAEIGHLRMHDDLFSSLQQRAFRGEL